MEFVHAHKILMNTQSGFRPGHSCETSLNLVLATWKEELDTGNSVIGVFLDFKRAFETIDRTTLLEKLKNIGMGQTAVKWIEDYLRNRRQQTEYNGQTSPELHNPYGVPQGSVLGPLLFILYINDIHTSVQHCKLNLFADETLLAITAKNIPDAVDKLNQDLETLSQWLQLNKLKLNIQKTKYMILGKHNVNTQYDIHIHGESLERVSVFKYLGVTIDDKLKFHEHVKILVSKMSSKIGVLYRASKKLTRSAKLTVYKSMLKPNFEYCSTILFLCSKTDITNCKFNKTKS